MIPVSAVFSLPRVGSAEPLGQPAIGIRPDQAIKIILPNGPW